MVTLNIFMNNLSCYQAVWLQAEHAYTFNISLNYFMTPTFRFNCEFCSLSPKYRFDNPEDAE